MILLILIELYKHIRYVENMISIEDVTELAKKIGNIHSDKNCEKVNVNALVEDGEILKERPYLPNCEQSDLIRLAMLPGIEATAVHQLGKGKAL